MPRNGELTTFGVFANKRQGRNNEFTPDELSLARRTGACTFAATMRGWTEKELDNDFNGRRFRKFVNDNDGRRTIAANLREILEFDRQRLAAEGKLDLIAAAAGSSVSYWLRVARDGYKGGTGFKRTAMTAETEEPLTTATKASSNGKVPPLAREKPDGGMFGIKRVGERHLSIPAFTTVYPNGDSRQALMNFKHNFERGATAIPVGHRALVYVVNCDKSKDHRDKPQDCAVGKAIWEIEFTGTLEDGERALERHDWRPETQEFPFHRPIRFLSRVDPPQDGPSVSDVRSGSGVNFNQMPARGGHIYRPKNDYERLRNAVSWTWQTGSETSKHAPAARSQVLPGLTGTQTPLAEDGYYRETEQRAREIVRRHSKLSNRFAAWLRRRGFTNVRQESGFVDVEFDHGDRHCKAEIKICESVGTTKGIRESLGQLLEYNYYPPREAADDWYIILDQQPSRSDIAYLRTLKEQIGLPLIIGWSVYRGFEIVRLHE